MVPKFDKFFYPVLLCLSDKKEHKQEDLRTFCIKHFKLNNEDIHLLVKSGSKTQVEDRTLWSTTYLSQAELIMRPKRGVYKITESGENLLKEKGDNIDVNELKKISTFDNFKNRHKKDSKGDDNSINDTSSMDKTPTEIMEDVFNEIHNQLKEELLEMVKKNTPIFFEHLVIRLLVAMGYGGSFEDAARVTQASHDDGIDGVIKEDKLGLDSIYIQAKRYTAGAVQKPDMQKFIGALSEQGATKGIFITTSDFSKGAIETIRNAKSVKIVLVNGETLAKYMIDYNIGVSTRQIYEVKRLDSDFFEED